MEPGAQDPGWNILTPNEVEVLKKAMPPDEPEVVDELDKAMREFSLDDLMFPLGSVRNDGNAGAISLDEKISIVFNVVKAVLFLLRATERKKEEAAAIVVDISPEEDNTCCETSPSLRDLSLDHSL
ncbi:unnamed protein product [Arabis nemorensis]|uniref:Uncharacterized protein n=1 Tax=Arabis nemorensis TaxID=586526 RepID=A0A565CR10_9BRAS|nr:unnamed protein product [Arabis nemorensis]